MSFKEYEAVGESSLYDGSGPTKAVLSRIAYLIRDKRPTPTCPVGWSNVSEGYLTKWTGFSERTVRAAIQTLVKDEIVFRQTYRIPGGFRKNRYALNMEAIKAALRPEFNPDVEEPQAGETCGEVDSDSPQAGETYTHRRNRPVPQAGETEATGGSRLKAVEFSSWGKQVDSAVTQADQTETDKSKTTPKAKAAVVNSSTPVHPQPPQATSHSAAAPAREYVDYTAVLAQHTWPDEDVDRDGSPIGYAACVRCGVKAATVRRKGTACFQVELPKSKAFEIED
jgi:hypothetical protein